MITFADYSAHDGLGLAERVRRGEMSAGELLEAALARIEAVDPGLNAVVRLRAERARAEAAAVQRDAPFAGVPFLLKDLIATLAGEPTGHGNRALAALAMPRDSTYVQRLRAAGLVIAGRTNTPEFGLTPYTEPLAHGPTRNPWSPAHSPGGSSGGSAAAVAARMVPLASGGDGGGSIRIPAACCGLFGLKPTRGRTPTGPDHGEIWHGFAIEHAITRSVRDSAALLDATAGRDAMAPYDAPPPMRPFLDEIGADPGRLRIAFTDQPLFGAGPVHPDCADGLRETARLLESLGHHVEPAAPVLDGRACALAFMSIIAAETWAEMAVASAALGRRPRPADYEPATYALALIGRAQSAAHYASASRTLQLAGRAMAPFFERFDLLLTPTLAAPPAPIGSLQPTPAEQRAMRLINRLGAGWLMKQPAVIGPMVERVFDYMPYTPLFNATGQPAMSVPLHWNAAGLPIGMHFVARLGDEATLLRLAAQLEAARPWFDRVPAES